MRKVSEITMGLVIGNLNIEQKIYQTSVTPEVQHGWPSGMRVEWIKEGDDWYWRAEVTKDYIINIQHTIKQINRLHARILQYK